MARETPDPVPWAIAVRRRRFHLDLFHRDGGTAEWGIVRRWPIAVGMEGLRTPPGWYEVQVKDPHPAYVYPDSEWVRDLGVEPGTRIPPDDPGNPIAPRWIGISSRKEIGIHGTNRPETLGTNASHGCVRMLPADVLELFGRVPLKTQVFVY